MACTASRSSTPPEDDRATPDRGGHGEERDPNQVREAAREACEQGNTNTCFVLAKGLVTEDPTSARALVLASCEKGNGEACFWYVGHQLAARTPPDWLGAAPMLERACELGHAYSCLAWGDLLRTGIGAEPDPAAANAAYAKACAMGQTAACKITQGDANARWLVHAIHTPDPPLSELASIGEHGEFQVRVGFCVQTDGTVEIGDVEGPKGLVDVARSTVQTWRFTPTAGKRVCSEAIFNLTID